MIGKILGWALLILIIVWIFSAPAHAGATVHGLINGIVTFFKSLANG